MFVACFFQSVRVPRSSHHQWPVRSVRCCLLTGAVKVRSTTPPIWTRAKSYVASTALTNTWPPLCLLQVGRKEDEGEAENQQPPVWRGFLFRGKCDEMDDNVFVIVKICKTLLSLSGLKVILVHTNTVNTWLWMTREGQSKRCQYNPEA